MEASNQVIEIMDYLGEKIGVTIDWTSENVLPYIESLILKFINWEIWTSVAWIGIAIFFIIAGIIFVAVSVKTESWTLELSIWILAGISIVAVLVIGNQIFDIITANVFPEKSIYDTIKSMKFWGPQT